MIFGPLVAFALSTLAGSPAGRGNGPIGPEPNATDGFAAAPIQPSDALPAHLIVARMAGGIGPGWIAGQAGVSSRVELTAGYGKHLPSLRYLDVEDINGSCGFSIDLCLGNVSLQRNSVQEIALAYGIKVRRRYLVGTASAGFATLWTVQRGTTLLQSLCFFACTNEYNGIDGHAFGATGELGGYLSSRFFSIGPTLVIDVNPIQSVWGVLIDVHLGWMGESP
jgi:hypothetical protein